MKVSQEQTDAECNSQRSSMRGQQRPLRFLLRKLACRSTHALTYEGEGVVLSAGRLA